MPPKIPTIALEAAHQRLKDFITRSGRMEWKAFKIVDASENVMENFSVPHKLEIELVEIMEKKVRLPCIVCQGHQGVIYCSITYTSKLSQKDKISQTKLRPPVYLVFFPYEVVFYATRVNIPDVIIETLTDLHEATRVAKLPLEGRDFLSLRQLHYNKNHKGLLSWRPVMHVHPIDSVFKTSGELDKNNGILHDEDEPWKKKKDEYYHKHFYAEKDPVITKFTISSTSQFKGTRSSRHLQCDMKVTFKSDNFVEFFDYAMEKGILSYPLNPYLENVVNLGSTSISLNSSQQR